MAALDEFREILVEEAPLRERTGLRVGGPAQWLAKPRDRDELSSLARCCRAEGIPLRVLGGGSNVLAPDEGVRGVVVQVTEGPFARIEIEGNRVRVGAGAPLPELIAQACRGSLTGLEVLAGIPGTVGGALVRNAGGRSGDIGQFVSSVEVMDREGAIATRMRADIRFGFRSSNLDDAIVIAAEFELVEDDPDDIVRRLKKVWIAKKASQPFGFQSSAYIFRNPRGLSAVELIEKADLRGAKVGGAEICSRDPKFILTEPDATARDVLRLIDLVRSKVQDRMGANMELQVDIW